MMEALNQQSTNIDSKADTDQQQSVNDVDEEKVNTNIDEDSQTASPEPINRDGEFVRDISIEAGIIDKEDGENQEDNSNNEDAKFQVNSQHSPQYVRQSNDSFTFKNVLENNTHADDNNLGEITECNAEAAAITQQNYENTLRSQWSRNDQVDAYRTKNFNSDTEEDELSESSSYEEGEQETHNQGELPSEREDAEKPHYSKETSSEKEDITASDNYNENEEEKEDGADEMDANNISEILSEKSYSYNKRVTISDDDSFHSTIDSEQSAPPERQQAAENKLDESIEDAEEPDVNSSKAFVHSGVIRIDDDSHDNVRAGEELRNDKMLNPQGKEEADENSIQNFTDSGRKVYNFVIDESSPESDCKSTCSKDNEENTNEVGDVLSDNRKNINNSIESTVSCDLLQEKQPNCDIQSGRLEQQNNFEEQYEKMESSSMSPSIFAVKALSPVKLNGDHKSSPLSTLLRDTDSCSSDKDDSGDNALNVSKNEKTMISETSACVSFVDDIDAKVITEKKSENFQNDVENDLHMLEGDDDSSRCSSLASSASSSSDTSSSQQLVIDHPMDEVDPTVAATSGCPQIPLNEEDIALQNSENLFSKTTLKRKRDDSTGNSMSPQSKHPHIELDESNDRKQNMVQNSVQITAPKETLSNQEGKDSPKAFTNPNLQTDPIPLKSLLLQHLQKPQTSPLVVASSVSLTAPFLPSAIQSKTFENVATSKDDSGSVSDMNEDSCSKTKYLCFKCKKGSFDSFAALNEHQRDCLADIRLLPTRISQISNSISRSIPSPLATPPTSASPADISVPFANNSPPPISMSLPTPPDGRNKHLYNCFRCGTMHDNVNLFLHIRDRHKRHMCMYCIRLFPTVEKLSVHLEIKHDLEQIHFHSEETLRRSVTLIDGTAIEERFLTCCNCQHLFEATHPFADHNCAEFIKPCTLCGQKGRHSNQCKGHPDAKRSSKAKKKKTVVNNTGHLQMKTSPRSQPAEQGIISGGAISNSSFHCDNNQNIHTNEDFCATLPPTATSIKNVLCEDSNSSSNMVIDESCTTTHGSSLVNPFKELDERWLMEQQLHASDELQESPEKNNIPTTPKLIVPKLKLRVPKEFQKSVDAALSSETEDDEEEEEEENHASFHKDGDLHEVDNNSSSDVMHDRSISQRGSEENSGHHVTPEDDESSESQKSNLARILQEIERTKMDIQRTKETLHHTTKEKHASIVNVEAVPSDRNWSPTPPSSPKLARWSMPAQTVVENEEQSFQNVQQREHAHHLDHRRNSAGSDVMDIDESITASAPPPPREEENDAAEVVRDDTQTRLQNNSENVDMHVDNNSTDRPNSSSLYTLTMENGDKIESPSQLEKGGEKNENQMIEPDILQNQEGHQPFCTTSNEAAKPESSPENERENPQPSDGIEVANEDTVIVDLQLDRPLEKFETVEFVRICLKAVYPLCLYCNHARRIAVNAQSLVLHMIAQHRFSATVDSITAEELKPDTIVAKLKTFLPILENEYFNSTSYCTMGDGAFTRHFNERIFECFQCRFVTSTHKELYLHNRKMHLKTAILCFMCRANFYSFSEILCHICPGAPNKTAVFDVKFRCCLCEVDGIPSPFRLMVHLRKRHCACDICLDDCRDQSRLSSHVWKHKLHHLCYRCGIAYRNKMDITKHLFWKHGTESIICKRCLQKRWRHVYHFCVPPTTFVCDICNLCFSKAMHLSVHKRIHMTDFRYPCTEENCEEKFISRKLLLKHAAIHQLPEALLTAASESTENVGETSNKERSNTVDEDAESKPTKVDVEERKENNGDGNRTTDVEKLELNDSILNATNSEHELKSNEESTVKSPKCETPSPDTEKSVETPRKKMKKNKRPKESLDDLNLKAPNLSESDSSDESETESKSRGDDDSLVPKVMLSPPSEVEDDKDNDSKLNNDNLVESANLDAEDQGTGKVLEIWKNFLQSQRTDKGQSDARVEEDYTEDNYPTPNCLHVAYSDHDYCKMFEPLPPQLIPDNLNTAEASPPKRSKPQRNNRRSSTRHSDGSSSSSESSSSTASSCSCGSNCSCSSSASSSSSSSSSSDDSDSSGGSSASRKRHRKKSERDRVRKKSESVSPVKKHTVSETVNVIDDTNEGTINTEVAPPPSPPKEPMFCESDLDTAESGTDEEFYDEHPQKLASELLAQKRAQLMAHTRLSPSHNFDIVENSRPSTPSLPEDVACESKIKFKKKKRDRKSSNKTNLCNSTIGIGHEVGAKFPSNQGPIYSGEQHSQESLLRPVLPAVPPYGTSVSLELAPQYNIMQSSPNVAEPPMAQQPSKTMPYTTSAGISNDHLTARTVISHLSSRMSEGSSCSDADSSLKRSKRARRPNKFYGYTSDDESMSVTLGQPLLIGSRAIKPQPPPQFIWHKDDLPTPSKSAGSNKNKTPRTPKVPATVTGATTTKKKRQTSNVDKTRKRSVKKISQNKLPPIPPLKIRPSQLGIITTGGSDQIYAPPAQTYLSSRETDEDESSDASSSDNTNLPVVNSVTSAATNFWNNNLTMPSNLNTVTSAVSQAAQVLLPALPPPPQTTVFNHKIPPALLPNPDFQTLQYFKANNIRYPIRPPAGARQAREGESVYCYCRCPYDEVSEMIACDGESCLIEWFHFECVGIMVAPQGRWFCAECRPRYSEGLYPNNGGAVAL